MGLLQQVLQANDADGEEEKVSIMDSVEMRNRPNATKRAGNLSSLSGGDDNVYMEFRSRRAGNSDLKHPLFKKFRK